MKIMGRFRRTKLPRIIYGTLYVGKKKVKVPCNGQCNELAATPFVKRVTDTWQCFKFSRCPGGGNKCQLQRFPIEMSFDMIATFR